MRVCLFTDTLGDLNGVSRFISDMGGLALEHHWQLHLITSTAKPLPELDNIRNLPARMRLPMPFYQELDLVWANSRRIRALLLELKPDLVHISTPGPFGWQAKRQAEKLGIPLIGTYHTDFPAYIYDLTGVHFLKRRTDRVMAKFYRPFEKVLSRSIAYTEVMANDLDMPRDRMAVIRPGTDLRKFHPRHEDRSVWQEFGLSDKRLKVLYVGRINVEKNIPFLCELWQAFQQTLIARNLPLKADLVMVGEGRYRKWTDKMRPFHGYFLGPLLGESLSKVYASSDLFIFPSVTDTLGQVVMEAQASGLGCLVSDIGGPQSLVLENQTGRVVPADEVDLWVKALLDVLSDKPLRQQWRHRAPEHMQAYDIEDSFADFRQIHGQVYSQVKPSLPLE
ncbi:glycosyltransferase family 1 protein [Thiomicrorhabdus sp. 6S3-12]|uniref:glycosyltransferase family 4 protein n=1 Tax=Thiomicrorhabdus sp. 6S3-12 TaxID=2819681 RepID=UPI001AAD9C53|nr:glycosyltransferase family 1 protein [Thiomicrorhabdus sp. 6S3-12]MBO1925072.1 glycosyltransferase family 1 protein [Thiomicrorhabdus sp. 6S3-12]